MTDLNTLPAEEQKAIEARRAYQRQWRAANKDKVKEHNRRFWLKKVADLPQDNQIAKSKNTRKVLERLSGVIEDRGELPSVSDYEMLEAAILKYGAERQIYMAIEEMSELTKALLKERRHAKNRDFDASVTEKLEDDIAEEMADVIIMLVQLQMMFNNKVKISWHINRKIKRLKQRMEESNERNGK